MAGVVPDAYEAYVRLHHPLPEGVRWAEAGPSYLQPGGAEYEWPFPEPLDQADEGNLDAEVVDRLIPMLATATSNARRCHFGLWAGWGELHPQGNTSVFRQYTPSMVGTLRTRLVQRRLRRQEIRKQQATYAFVGSCAVEPWWGGRDMLLFDGPIEAVRSIGAVYLIDNDLHRRSPQWWWPEDRAWFLATEIDYPWTYVGGAAELITQILSDSELEVVEVHPEDAW